jgi:hypothetical protein
MITIKLSIQTEEKKKLTFVEKDLRLENDKS